MKIERLILCYPDMDRIIVEKPKNGTLEDALNRFDLSKVSAIDATVSLTLEEFHRLRSMNQHLLSTGTGTVCDNVNIVAVPEQSPVAPEKSKS